MEEIAIKNLETVLECARKLTNLQEEEKDYISGCMTDEGKVVFERLLEARKSNLASIRREVENEISEAQVKLLLNIKV